MEVNFKGKYLNSTYVRKFNPTTKKYVPEMVHFVEINSQNKKDIKTLKKMAQSRDEMSFANQIYQKAKSKPNLMTYVLTNQSSDYEILSPEDVLGVCQLSKENYDVFCLEHLQTKPEFQQENKDREYKRIGRRIVHSLKKIFYDKTLRVNYLFDKIPFYMDNGFDSESDLFGDLTWKAQKRKSNL